MQNKVKKMMVIFQCFWFFGCEPGDSDVEILVDGSDVSTVDEVADELVLEVLDEDVDDDSSDGASEDILDDFSGASDSLEVSDVIEEDSTDTPPEITPEECVVNLSDLPLADIYSYIYENEMPVIVKLYTDWCGWCQRYMSVFQNVCMEYGEVRFAEIEVEEVYEREGEMIEFCLGAIPTTHFFYEGVEVMTVRGYKTEEQLRGYVENFLQGIEVL